MLKTFIVSLVMVALSALSHAQETSLDTPVVAEQVSVEATPPTSSGEAPRSVARNVGQWLGGLAKKAVNVSKSFTDGVKHGFDGNPAKPEGDVQQVAQSAPVVAAPAPTAPAARPLSKVFGLFVGRQSPAPVEVRDVQAVPAP